MSVIVSISEDPNGIWMLNNRAYRWFAHEVMKRMASDPDASKAVEMSEIFHALLLDRIVTDDYELAIRLRDSLVETAGLIRSGELDICASAMAYPEKNGEENLRSLFSELEEMLLGWAPRRISGEGMSL